MTQSIDRRDPRSTIAGTPARRGGRAPGAFHRLAGYLAAFALSGSAVACGVDDDRMDKRGPIELLVDGEPYGIHADRFQAEYAEDDAMAFHMHEDSENWYIEGFDPVTVAEGLDLLPRVAFDPEGPVLSVDGASYDASEPGVVIEVLVDGEAVNPADHVLDDGERLRVEIETP